MFAMANIPALQDVEKMKYLGNILKAHGPNAYENFIKFHGGSIDTVQLADLAIMCVDVDAPESSQSDLPPMVKNIHEFIGKIIPEVLNRCPSKNSSHSYEKDLFTAVPFGLQLSLSKAKRLRLFFKTVKRFDLLFAKVFAKRDECYHLTFICFANGRLHYIEDLNVKAILPAAKMRDEVNVGAIVEVGVFGCSIKDRTLYVTASIADFQEAPIKPLKLGPITQEELPAHYKSFKKYQMNPFTFSPDLEKYYEHFHKQNLDNCLRLKWSNLPHYKKRAGEELSQCSYASAIQERHLEEFSDKQFNQGKAFAIEKDYKNALESFFAALQHDSKNVGAMFHIGYVYTATRENKKAVEMFEKVLTIDPNHDEAKMYLSRALTSKLASSSKAYFSSGEDKAKIKELLTLCERICKVNPNNSVVLSIYSKLMYNNYQLKSHGPVNSYQVPKNIANKDIAQSFENIDLASGSDMEIDNDSTEECLPSIENLQPSSAKGSAKATPPAASSTQSVLQPTAQSSQEAIRKNYPQEDLLKVQCDEFVNRLKNRDIKMKTEPSESSTKSDGEEKRRHSHHKHKHSKKKRKHRKHRKEISPPMEIEDTANTCKSFDEVLQHETERTRTVSLTIADKYSPEDSLESVVSSHSQKTRLSSTIENQSKEIEKSSLEGRSISPAASTSHSQRRYSVQSHSSGEPRRKRNSKSRDSSSSSVSSSGHRSVSRRKTPPRSYRSRRYSRSPSKSSDDHSSDFRMKKSALYFTSRRSHRSRSHRHHPKIWEDDPNNVSSEEEGEVTEEAFRTPSYTDSNKESAIQIIANVLKHSDS